MKKEEIVLQMLEKRKNKKWYYDSEGLAAKLGYDEAIKDLADLLGVDYKDHKK